MFFEITDNSIKRLQLDELNLNNLCFGYIKYTDIDKVLDLLEIENKNILDLISYNKNYRTSIYSFEDLFISLLNIKNINNIRKDVGKLGIMIKNNFIIIFIIKDSDNYLHSNILNLIKNLNYTYTLEKIINTLIEITISGDLDIIQYYDDKIISIENELLKNNTLNNLNSLIFSIKKELILYKRYYDSILNFIVDIKNNFSLSKDNANLNILSNLENKVLRINNNIQYLIENTVHLREIYQSALDSYQNKIIKLLTLITTIFLPLSLVTGWYGMNLESMPEIYNEYSYPIIIIVSLLIIITILFIFKKKKIL